jgi:hypothetical protein
MLKVLSYHLIFSVDQSNLCQAAQHGHERPVFRRVLLNDDVPFHVANIGGKAFAISAEISSLINRWNSDILSKMLKTVKESKPSVTVKKDEAPELFREAERYSLVHWPLLTASLVFPFFVALRFPRVNE